MATNNTTLKQTKWIISLVKEKLWLEEMALKGWHLSNLTWGIRYTFEKREPKKLIYEIDRFNLPKHPTLKEIKHKAEFIDVATEMGWKVIVHDEDQNYYFCKEYKEGEINELYNDYDSKQFRAQKYYNHYKDMERIVLTMSFIMAILGLIMATFDKINSSSITGFIIFLFGYQVFCMGSSIIINRMAHAFYKDLLMTTQEWKELYENYSKRHKSISKFLLTNNKCTNFFTKQSREGWHIVNMAAFKYTFAVSEPVEYIYTIDSKYLTNMRMKAKGADKLKDNKDWLGVDNDWQVQSLKDAESKKWAFVCALENQAILYRNQESVIPDALNEKRYEKRFRFNSFVGQLGKLFLLGALLGFIASYVKYFNL